MRAEARSCLPAPPQPALSEDQDHDEQLEEHEQETVCSVKQKDI